MKTSLAITSAAALICLLNSCTKKPAVYKPIESIAYLKSANAALDKQQQKLDREAIAQAETAEASKPLNSLFSEDILELDFQLDKPTVTGSDTTAPEVKKAIAPQYPQAALKEKIEGKVYIAAIIKADGSVGKTSILKTDHESLNQAALQAAKYWKFEPATYKGNPVNCKLGIPFLFKLKIKEQ